MSAWTWQEYFFMGFYGLMIVGCVGVLGWAAWSVGREVYRYFRP